MKLLFKQRVFSWFDSYDIYNENQEVVYSVKGKMSWGHCLVIYDAFGEEIGGIKEQVFTFLPRFHMYVKGEEVGCIEKEFSLFKPKFHLSCNDWKVNGSFMEWEYEVTSTMRRIMSVSKEIFHWADTYVLDIENEQDALYCLMIVLAIDAVKCSQGNS